jgi:hypothetical protein
MNKKIIGVGILSFVSITTLSAYTNVQREAGADTTNHTQQMRHQGQHISEYASNNTGSAASHKGSAVRNYTNLYNSDIIPTNIEPAMDPTYGPGEEVTITEGHMPGMMGAQAEIVGAFATQAYSVSYSPTDGGEPVNDHKWVVQEEIADAGEEPFEVGTEVILEANHMTGMDGPTATIEAVEDTTVYVIDYQPTDGGERVQNHKWMTDSELSPVDAEVESDIEEGNVNFDNMEKFMEEGNVNFDNMEKFMEEGNVNFDDMEKFMEEGNVNFGRMKSYMSETHPDLDNQESNEWYKGMHGTGGSSQSSNFRGMGNMY